MRGAYTTFNRSYLVASRAYLNIAIGFFDLFHKSAVCGISRILLMGIKALYTNPSDLIDQFQIHSYAAI
jgi:hypothetical protein